MSVTSEAPAAFRNAASRPGPLALIGEAWRDVASRRRLVRYLVQAEIKRRYGGLLLPVGHATCVPTGAAQPSYLISTPTMTASSAS